MRKTIEKILVTFLPTHLYRLLGGLYGFFISKNLSYSQYGEDLIIENFFKRISLSNGVYLDIGAFHPKWLSNSHLLHLAGWKGSAVDIDTYKIKLFKLARKDCLGITGAVSPGETGEIKKVFRFRRLWSEIDTLSEEDAKAYKKSFGIDYDVSEIRTLTINEVFRRTTEKFGKVNFVNIDIEGLDEEILFDLDFKTYSPDLICFENNQYFTGSPALKKLLEDQGYAHLFTTGGTHGYFKLATLGHSKS